MFAGRAMDKAHDGLGIADPHFDRVVDHLVATLSELGIPEATIGQIGEALSPLREQIVTA